MRSQLVTSISKQMKLIATVTAISMAAAACSGSTSSADQSTEVSSADATATDASSTEETAAESSDTKTVEAGSVFDSSTVHSISVEFDQDEYEAVIQVYKDSSEKEWISATVTIDGETYTDVGLRLKGNSSLRSLATGGGGGTGGEISEDEPEGLPWLIRLDKYVDSQNHDGSVDFVVRSNSSESSLNEAVALELLQEAGLAGQEAIAVRFSVNGSDEQLRLVIENPDDVFMESNFDDSGALYKAESSGDYDYHGDDPDDYDEVFDQEAGKDNADLTPVIEFMDFLNNSDDETFASDLSQWLDVDAFAAYLAMQDIVNNFDDIDGPGNNSYLYYDTSTEQFTVVPWDYNLAFGGIGGAGGGGFGGAGGGEGGGGFGGERPAIGDGEAQPGRGGFAQGDIPEGGELPEGFEPGAGFPEDGELPEGFEPGSEFPEGGQQQGGFGGGLGGSNTLVERFLANDNFTALYEQTLADLTVSLVDSGVGEAIVAEWVAVLEAGASDLIDQATLESEAQSIVDGL